MNSDPSATSAGMSGQSWDVQDGRFGIEAMLKYLTDEQRETFKEQEASAGNLTQSPNSQISSQSTSSFSQDPGDADTAPSQQATGSIRYDPSDLQPSDTGSHQQPLLVPPAPSPLDRRPELREAQDLCDQIADTFTGAGGHKVNLYHNPLAYAELLSKTGTFETPTSVSDAWKAYWSLATYKEELSKEVETACWRSISTPDEITEIVKGLVEELNLIFSGLEKKGEDLSRPGPEEPIEKLVEGFLKAFVNAPKEAEGAGTKALNRLKGRGTGQSRQTCAGSVQ